ncbi:methyltransferase domain-containing protein [Colidextribacter sp. OB.20]|nr:methyltransferase domain-containing protein [Colidextribacter sp. OB.20]
MDVGEKKIILFGAGDFGRRALEYFGAKQVYCFADNNPQLAGTDVEGIPVRSFEQMKEICQDYRIVISVNTRIAIVLAKQLEEAGIKEYDLFVEMMNRAAVGSAKLTINYVTVFQKAERWLLEHSVPGAGIINNTDAPEPYPEVTGYFIPSLLRWGYRELALTYARWLCSIQKSDGSWYDTFDRAPYVFDTAQILKGLLAIRDLYPEADDHIKRGCDWILTNVDQEGRIHTPDQSQWNKEDTSDLIYLYCLSPLYKASAIFSIPEYTQKADKVKAYYIQNRMDEIMGFRLLSHFQAYVLEALCDLGETDLARRAMENIAQLQREDGMVPARRSVNWVCSTGLFQLALVWYKLDELERGNRALQYACSLQNQSGGWYGSYATVEGEIRAFNEKEYPRYFTNSEISWAVKYFLDALAARCQLEFERHAGQFYDFVDKEDGRYQLILAACQQLPHGGRVCDAGCGKGRYVRNLLEDTADQSIQFSCVDISENVLNAYLPEDIRVEAHQGTLTEMPYPDEAFDMVYTCEALEHAVGVENALKELLRITRTGGKVIVIDKPKSAAGFLPIETWEQLIDDSILEKVSHLLGCRLEIARNLPYDVNKQDGLFDAWILEKGVI